MFEWLRAKNKMKRWLVVIIAGILLTCYGMARVLVTEEMALKEVAPIVAIFAARICFNCMGIGVFK